MVRWTSLYIPEEYGGLGLLDTRTMIDALLGRGWSVTRDTKDICASMLRKKYLEKRAFLQDSGRSGSQFWKEVIQNRNILKWGVHINNGKQSRFWEEIWAGPIPLKLEFPTLYLLCEDKDSLVSDYWSGDGWKLGFKRPLGSDMEEWESMMLLLDDYSLNDKEDVFRWVLEKSGRYSTKSMYRRHTFRGVMNRRMQRLWKSKLPQKLNVFMWLAIQNRIETGVNLKKGSGRGKEKCCLCDVAEDMDHIFIKCKIAKVFWECVKEALG